MKKTTKGLLSHCYGQLKQLGHKMSDLTNAQMLIEIESLQEILEGAKASVRAGGFKPTFAIGVVPKPDEIGMIYGPKASLEEVLMDDVSTSVAARYGDLPVFIFECSLDDDGHPVTIPLHRWNGQGWKGPLLEV